MDELFDIYDNTGRRVGTALRSAVHGNPALLHHAAHVLVFDRSGRLLLQKRKMNKRIQPGKWDASVGGHLSAGESFETGAARELQEELGLSADTKLEFLFDIEIRNEIESEDARVFRAESEGPFHFQEEEIDEVRFFTPEELKDPAWREKFTPCLCRELDRLYE